jgi:hypothetical protein
MGQEAQIRRLAGARKSKNSPPFLSQEFIIQNHGDIFSCAIVLVMAMFMSNVSSSILSHYTMLYRSHCQLRQCSQCHSIIRLKVRATYITKSNRKESNIQNNNNNKTGVSLTLGKAPTTGIAFVVRHLSNFLKYNFDNTHSSSSNVHGQGLYHTQHDQ